MNATAKFELYGLWQQVNVAALRQSSPYPKVVIVNRYQTRPKNTHRGAIEAMAQMVSLPAGAQIPCARYVDWLQVQGFLDMAESALRAKNAANDVGFALH